MQQNPTQDMQPQLSAVCSMTGYGRARQMIGNKEITVELRSVNHRFLEYSSRVPRAYAYLEDKLKNLVKGSVSRGKVDVTLSVQTISGTDTQVIINHDLARSYLEALRDLAEDLQIKNDVSVSQMARFSDIFSVVKVEENEEEMWQAVQQVAQQAVQNFVDMRRAEGEKMKQDLLSPANHRAAGSAGGGAFAKDGRKLHQAPVCQIAGGFAEQYSGRPARSDRGGSVCRKDCRCRRNGPPGQPHPSVPSDSLLQRAGRTQAGFSGAGI